MKKNVETQTESETDHEGDNDADIEFIKITPSHPRERLKRKVAKIKYL